MRVSQRIVSLLAALLILVAAPGVARAQGASWGVVGTVVPEWQVPTALEALFEGTVDIKGSDLSIGIARGRDLGGDWGVSYIRKNFKDGSRVESVELFCGEFINGCFREGESVITRGVRLNGVEVHKYVPFGTIRRRVQIGMNFAGGIGSFGGNVETHEFSSEPIGFGRGRQSETVRTEPASELLGSSTLPLLKVQLAVGIIVTPALKIRAQGGLDLPGYEKFSISGVYFFGAR